MNKIDKIIKQNFERNANLKVDISSDIMNKIKDYKEKKENLRFKTSNYFLSFFILILSMLSIYFIEILLPDFKVFFDLLKINYFLIKLIFQGFFIFFIITVIFVLLNNLLKSFKNYHLKMKNLII
ncbi:MAG: hypothetical protein JXB50_00530 [Spirochaetes bacterium]|nr:hypothetical protein [Spirochaetota bacterium]